MQREITEQAQKIKSLRASEKQAGLTPQQAAELRAAEVEVKRLSHVAFMRTRGDVAFYSDAELEDRIRRGLYHQVRVANSEETEESRAPKKSAKHGPRLLTTRQL